MPLHLQTILISVASIIYLDKALSGEVLGSSETVVTTNENTYEVTIDEQSKYFPENNLNVKSVFFHFSELTLSSGETLKFINNGKLVTDNLVSFVESNNPATIGGTIDTTDYENSQLFLISRNGLTLSGESKFISNGDIYLASASGLYFEGDELITHNTAPPIYLNESPSKMVFDGTNSGEISFTSPNPGPIDSIGFQNIENSSLKVISNEILFDASRIKLKNGDFTAIATGSSDSSYTIGESVDIENTGGKILLSNGSSIETENGGIQLFSEELVMENYTEDAARNSITAIFQSKDRPNIEISATNSIKLVGKNSIISSSGAKNGGTPHDAIIIENFDSLLLSGSSTISSDGRSGDIIIQSEAGGVVVSSSLDSETAIPSRISTSSSDNGTAGNIIISVKSLSLDEGGTIEAASSGFRVDDGGLNIGSAGNISIRVDRLKVDSGKITNQNSGTTSGGSITVIASGSALVTGINSSIVSSTTGAGTGGDINVQTPRLFIDNGGKILSEARSSMPEIELGESGSIFLDSGNILLTDGNSEISVKTDGSDAGNIVLKTTGIFTIKNGASLNTSATKQGGSGGNITINGLAEGALLRIIPSNDYDPNQPLRLSTSILAGTEDKFGGEISFRNISVAGLRPRSEGININAEAGTAQGVPGEVRFINASIDSVSGTEELPGNILDSSALTSRRCYGASSDRSNFYINDHQGIRSTPDGLISSAASWLARVNDIGPKKSHLALARSRYLNQPVFFTCEEELR